MLLTCRPGNLGNHSHATPGNGPASVVYKNPRPFLQCQTTTPTMSDSKLFQPTTVGGLPLAHRVVFAPCGRCRADSAHVPSPLAPEYYSQRGSTPGTLIIAEATVISPEAGGMLSVPGIYSDA
ncbi:hypothetical protein PLICRDRAFT_452830 [Plicaturopsis crispa FD-325 SS-3]|uniref:NADH:flavin oxidoreductase/NADH oxidase N-terminal domain-containing protein n=1 Tax=Plicaturopsis crispa FD-325 SS-3 TaxID=944288 RepID=A0A0C9SK78_PLICR|nr:hypothetical protein PLICRDRAFT_452830 [Plicaturopsis crispa FD-325 SS-3]